MNKWTFVMKDYFFDEIKKREEIPWNSPKDIKKDDIIFIYSTTPKKYIDYILKAISDPYNDSDNNLTVKVEKLIEIPQPVELQELKDDPILSKWAPVNKKRFIFQGAHHKMSDQQSDELLKLIIKKNPEIEEQIKFLTITHNKIWIFSVNKDNFNKLNDDITWNSAREVKKDDLILFYRGEPERAITDIFLAKSNPYEDLETKGNRSIDIQRLSKIMDPPSWETLKNNPILKEWAGVKMHFGKSHFKIYDEAWKELKTIISDNNPELEKIFDKYDNSTPDSQLKQRVWKITPGEWDKRDVLWENFKEDKVIGIGWIGDSVDYFDFNSLDDVRNGLIQFYGEPKEASAKMIWNFIDTIHNGDIVVANAGVKKVIGIGVIKSGYIAPKNPENPASNPRKAEIYKDYVHFRKIKWHIKDAMEFKNQFFDLKTITELNRDKWNEIKKLYLTESGKYENIFKEIEGNDSLKFYLEKILNNYHKAITDKNSEIAKKVKDCLLINLPELLKEKTHDQYYIFSSAEDKWHYCPYVALMNEEITTQHTSGLYVNFMLREDMSGVYLSLRQEVKGIDAGDNYLKELKNKADVYRDLVRLESYSIFSDEIDLKAKKTAFAPFYEAANIYSKFYPINNLPSEEELISDLNKILELYNTLTETIIHPIYENLFLKPEDIETGLKFDSNIFEQVCGTLNSKKHIMLTGAPGTGKTDLAEAICKSVRSNRFSDGYILTTATSDWTTYDTIGGYMPSNDGKSLKFEEGKFLQAIKENKWLIIDEINRADIDKAFGQLFTVLSGQSVEIPFKDGNKPIKIERINDNRSYYDQETATYNVGNNWRIIATMNVFDKDYLFEMSYAFMRRFTFIYIDLPEDEDFQYLIYDKWGENVDDGYLFLIEGLLEINKHRPIGPAIFKDMVEYAHERHKISDQEDGYQNQIIKDTIISFILPQFEGLELLKIHDIWNKVLSKYDVQDDLKARLEEISGITLVPKSSEEDD